MTDENPSMADPLGAIADEFVATFRQGKRPSVEEFARRYPEQADEIRDVLPTLMIMEQAKVEEEGSGRGGMPAAAPLGQLGDYQILREVGRGGMGVVYEAAQVSLGRHVALKVLPQKLLMDARSRQRFVREARSVARLHHTNIVPVFGVGEHDGLPYYVMQFIQGKGLDAVLEELKQLQPGPKGDDGAPRPLAGKRRAPRRDPTAADFAVSLLTGEYVAAEGVEADEVESEGTVEHTPGQAAGLAATPATGAPSDSFVQSAPVVLPRAGSARRAGDRQPNYWQSVARIGVQVAEALDYAHRQGITHRDIKPSNLLLDTRGVVWVTDFGLAKAQDTENLTHTGEVFGTLRYMPPEAFDGRCDARSDVYSLGLTLYELLALRPAFDEKERNKLIKQVSQAEPAPLRKVNPQVPRDLDTIVHKAIEREPASRYQSASELTDDLQRFLDDEPIRARCLTGIERVARWARRHKELAAALLVLTLGLVTVAIGSTIAAVKYQQVARENRGLAEQAAEMAEQREEQRQLAEASRLEQQRLSVRLLMERGISFCEQDQFGQGLLWLGRGLELVPPEDVALQQSFRTLLGGWGRRLPAQRAILQLPAIVESAAVSPDGQTILVGCADGTAWVWRMKAAEVFPPNGDVVRPPVLGQPTALHVGHRGPVSHVAFSPDGRMMATASQDGTVELRTLAGERRGQPLRHQGPVRALAFSPDSKTLASASNDHTARLWDVATATAAGEPLRHKLPVRAVAFSPDGARLATGGDDGVGRLWNAATGQPVGAVLQHESNVRTVAFSRDGRVVLTAGNDGTARTWDAATGRSRGEPIRHSRPVAAVAFSPDGGTIVTACEDSNLYYWHAATLRQARPPLAHAREMFAAAFSPGGRTLLTGCYDNTARLWDVASGRLLGDPMRSHSFLNAVAFSSDGRFVVTAGDDRLARVWETPARNRPFRRFGPMDKPVAAVAFSPDGRSVFVASEQGRSYDVASGRLLSSVAHPKHLIASAAYSPDGKTLATGSFDDTVRLWDATTGQPQGEPLWHLKPSWVLGVAFSPDGRTLVTGSGDFNYPSRRGEAQVWNLATGRLRHRLTGHDREVTAVAFSPDGKTIATASRDRTVRFWDAVTGQPTGQAPRHSDWVVSVAFSPTGAQVVSGCNDRTARVWDVATGKQTVAALEHPKRVTAAAFSPDGRLILTGCEDGAARLWDAASGRLVDVPFWYGSPVLATAFSPDGRRFLSGTQDGFAHLAEVPMPWKGSAKSTRHWVRVNAHLDLDPSAGAKPLGEEDWRQELRQWHEAHLAEAAR